jgi:hypothetical protein
MTTKLPNLSPRLIKDIETPLANKNNPYAYSNDRSFSIEVVDKIKLFIANIGHYLLSADIIP